MPSNAERSQAAELEPASRAGRLARGEPASVRRAERHSGGKRLLAAAEIRKLV